MPPDISYGFPDLSLDLLEERADSANSEVLSPRPLPGSQVAGAPERNGGLGSGIGGQLSRSCLGSTGLALLEPRQRYNRFGGHRGSGKKEDKELLDMPLSPRSEGGGPLEMPASLSDGPEPQGFWQALLLGDARPAVWDDLAQVRSHRWTFRGAEDFASKDRGFCNFIRCLLELQRNVQLEEEGDALEPRLARACRAFVGTQVREGRGGEMYQLLTHFISNCPVFQEWDLFLRSAFEDARANQEAFLIPHLEQVWYRFRRLRAVLENVFGVLDTRFIWRHRLPTVADLLRDHMRRRCFASETVARNELFSQAAARNEVVKQVRFAFGFQ